MAAKSGPPLHDEPVLSDARERLVWTLKIGSRRTLLEEDERMAARLTARLSRPAAARIE